MGSYGEIGDATTHESRAAYRLATHRITRTVVMHY
jgi:hypothetical protein